MIIPWIGWLCDDYPKIVQDHSDLTPDEYDKVSAVKDIKSYVSNMRDGSVAGFKYFDIKGLKKIAIHTKGYGRGRMEVYAADRETPDKKELICTIPVSSKNTFIRWEGDASVKDGVYALYFIFRGESNLNLLDFELI